MAIRILCRKLVIVCIVNVSRTKRSRHSDAKLDANGCSCAMEQAPQLPLRGFQSLPARSGQLIAAAVDIEGQHRHRRSIRIRLTPMTCRRGALQRTRDALWIVAREDSSLQDQGITRSGDLRRPSLFRAFTGFRGLRAFPDLRALASCLCARTSSGLRTHLDLRYRRSKRMHLAKVPTSRLRHACSPSFW